MTNQIYNPYHDSLSVIQSKENWSWIEYFIYKEKLEQEGIEVILVDMTGHPVEDSINVSDDLFFEQEHPQGTYFALYCDSGCSISGFTKDKLTPLLLQYNFVDISSGAGMYMIEKMNAEFFSTTK